MRWFTWSCVMILSTSAAGNVPGLLVIDNRCDTSCGVIASYEVNGYCPEECGDGGYCCRSDDHDTNKCSNTLKAIVENVKGNTSNRHYCLSTHPCDRPIKGGCEQICTKDGLKAICGCKYDGWKLSTDGKTCKHPCDQVSNGGCNQTCTKDGWKTICVCADDWTLSGDGKTCEREAAKAAAKVCQEDFKLVNGVCVKVFCGSPVTWYGARDACFTKNAILASINDAETNKLIAEGHSGKLWIGRTDEETEGTWTNVLGDSVTYSNWDSKDSQPDNHNHISPEHYKGGEHCGIMNWSTWGKWADFPCKHLQDCFACQMVEECSKGLVFKDGKCQKVPNPCPGSAGGEPNICWDYNANTDACTLNTKSCRTSLTCSKTAMTITFDKYLFGTENDSLKTAFNTIGTCLTETKPRTDGGFTWTGGFGDCGMEIATEGTFITMKKTLSIGNTDSGITLGGTKIYASGSKKTTVEFTCKYASSATATSDAIDINAPVDVSATVTEAFGTFTSGLSFKHYTDANYKTITTDPIAIGSIVFPMITWEVNTSKLGFYIENCDVIDVTDPKVPNPADPRIPIISKTCYAGVVGARISPDRASGLFNHKEAKFSYRSFSFTTDSADKQKISCTIQFCTTNLDGSRKCTGDDYVGAKPVVDVNKCPSTAQFNYAL